MAVGILEPISHLRFDLTARRNSPGNFSENRSVQSPRRLARNVVTFYFVWTRVIIFRCIAARFTILTRRQISPSSLSVPEKRPQFVRPFFPDQRTIVSRWTIPQTTDWLEDQTPAPLKRQLSLVRGCSRSTKWQHEIDKRPGRIKNHSRSLIIEQRIKTTRGSPWKKIPTNQ